MQKSTTKLDSIMIHLLFFAEYGEDVYCCVTNQILTVDVLL